MLWFPIVPTRKSTPSEYAVLVVSISVILIILGIIALVVASLAPVEKHELAEEVAHRGIWSLGIGVAIAIAYWLFRRLKD